ncbi:DSBA-like thioredoxin domain-containing protein [Pseudomassariella vexata]|uniref:DSBA-like thioredoxin domain-containing protein n=1 Tax=Pseudomassariella vexata TaxID=1141098 RepID=A0A1Y2DTF5_9PEZI|nr:DSBA-like thioredoxin domain-containing protein [Pseudomassariella vexata]ORY62562.1 DSBA-like thioredoxin domain-containing protein [Pseudomassariella vexata]
MHFIIEFILDTICPHCFIGFKNLERAIEIYKARHPGATFEITCSPFILNPLAPRTIPSNRTWLTQVRGHPDIRLHEWTQRGHLVGIDFDFDGLSGNSRDSHKLLRLALEPRPTIIRSTAFAITGTPSPYAHSPPRGPALQLRLLEAIYRGHFESRHGIGDREWLLEVGVTVLGLPREEVRACLESEEWGLAIDTLDSEVRSRGFRGIPGFVIQGRFKAEGWQEPGFFADVFEKARERMVEEGGGDGHHR